MADKNRLRKIFALFVAVLIFASIAFDFGDCFYPSRARPYVTSGRLILGALIPFWIMYLRGLESLLGRLRWKYAPLAALLALVLLMAVSEAVLVLSTDVFASPYNWYHPS